MTNNQQGDFSSILNNLKTAQDRQQTANNLMSSMSAEDNKKLFEILGDKEKLSAILNSPAAQAIMQKINGQHK
ncbi:MAG: hypothetical protein MJ168_08760 [Clostridia bacterium]|nr:hypothetical protein [Clostridia bacterium]